MVNEMLPLPWPPGMHKVERVLGKGHKKQTVRAVLGWLDNSWLSNLVSGSTACHNLRPLFWFLWCGARRGALQRLDVRLWCVSVVVLPSCKTSSLEQMEEGDAACETTAVDSGFEVGCSRMQDRSAQCNHLCPTRNLVTLGPEVIGV